MAARKLAAFVHVYDGTGDSRVFGPDDTVPEEFAKRITNPDAWASEPDPDPGDGPSDAWTNAQLVAYAKDREIDLGEATKKADILAAIRSAEDD